MLLRAFHFPSLLHLTLFVLESATVFEHLPVRSFHHRSVGACIHIGEFLYQFRKNDDVVILGLWPTTFSKESGNPKMTTVILSN